MYAIRSYYGEKVQIVSKFGYIQGSTMARLEAGEVFEEVVEYAPHVFHCIHPDFMRDQLERSLERRNNFV